MKNVSLKFLGALLAGTALLSAAGCGPTSSEPVQNSAVQAQSAGPDAPVGTSPVVYEDAEIFATPESTSRFLHQATFGATPAEIKKWTGGSASQWFREEIAKPSTNTRALVDSYIAVDPNTSQIHSRAPIFAFWVNAVGADDQLRQRTGFALSQILVVSQNDNQLRASPEALGYYQDLLIDGAFSNYRDILEDVTYSPAMADYLTYLGSRKGNPATGQMPDENYAREVLQLFTIGLVMLEPNGNVMTDASGDPIETYDNDDITGLAKVFTGFAFPEGIYSTGFNNADRDRYRNPIAYHDDHHSDLEKNFLGLTIPAGTDGPTSIDMALDHIFDHPNVAPFISRQLIQRFTTSDPEPVYVRRVALAFESGYYTLPDGVRVGSGERGCLEATIAAVLFDETVRDESYYRPDRAGKIREPIIRFTNWARAFDAGTLTPEYTLPLWLADQADMLGQAPYKSPSVFNFYRPGYKAPGSLTGAEGMTVPELQIMNATSTPGYINFMDYFIFEVAKDINHYGLQSRFDNNAIMLDANNARTSYMPDYTLALSYAGEPERLVDFVDLVLTSGRLSEGTKSTIIAVVENVTPASDGTDYLKIRVQVAISLVMSSPDYLLQR